MLSAEEKERLVVLAAKLSRNRGCFSAPKGVKEKKGLGDVVAAMTSAVGIRPCKGCKRRQAWLNKIRW
jgi:pantoate kinase